MMIMNPKWILALLVMVAHAALAETKWIDVTARFLKNPGFDTSDRSDWNLTGEATSLGAVSFSCMEMWNGYMRLEHTQTDVPNGHYRISVQGLYRTRAHDKAYERYKNGTEAISGFLFAQQQQVALQSEYSFHFNESVGRCYTPDEKVFFPNSMETAQMAFATGAYNNELEFDVTDGHVKFGLYNSSDMARSDNWMIFDGFKILQQVEVRVPQKGSLCLNEVMASNVDVIMSPAYNFDGWIELYNPLNEEVTLGGCYLSDDASMPMKWRIPDGFGNIPARGYRVVWMGSNNINAMQAPFKLDAEGGLLMLSNQRGEELFCENYAEAIGRTSWARTTDGGAQWAHTATPTPQQCNDGAAYANEQLEAPVIARQGGFFDSNFTLRATAPEGTTLRYTTDGTTPTMTNGATMGAQGIAVTKNMSVRFRLFQEGKLPSEVVTRTFVKRDHRHTLPAIMVSTDARYLYDDSIGVYVRGVNGRTGNGQSSPVNWNMDWDRPVNFHYVLPGTDEVAVNQDVDFSISGGWTRANNPKSFKLKADRIYGGQNAFSYPFFDSKPFLKNKTIQVRFGGNDSHCRIKDAALHEIIQRSGIDLDVMSYQPAVHYLNGEYKGLINVREPNNKDFAYANWGLSKDELEVYEQSPDSGAYMMLGTKDVLERLYELSKQADNDEVYEEIASLLDIDEYVNYMAAELFLSSWDWPDNNLKAYRKTDGGRYRITFFDLDAAFGTEGREYDEEGEVYMGGNPLRWMEGMQWHRYDYIYDTAERRYGEIKFCTFFLNMLRNEGFRQRFVTMMTLMGGSVFLPERAEAILDELGERVRPTMAWEGASPDGSLNEIRQALRGRSARMADYMKDYELLGLSERTTRQMVITTNTKGSTIYLNGETIPYGDFDGSIFLPATVSVDAPAGYRFKGWASSSNPSWYYSLSDRLVVTESTNIGTLVACFEPDSLVAPVVVNEVSASNSVFVNDYQKRNDWVELYNTTDREIDVEGMYLSDDLQYPDKYLITGGNSELTTIIKPHDYLVVWCDKLEPLSQLHAPFKLSAGGGIVTLMSKDKSWTDRLVYDAHSGMESVGRYPDGTANVYKMNIPTIARSNLHTSYMTDVSQDILNHIDDVKVDQDDLSVHYVARHLIVNSSSAERLNLTIYTLSGQEVMKTDVHLYAGRGDVDCSRLSVGCYLAKLCDEKGRFARCKFVVNNH